MAKKNTWKDSKLGFVTTNLLIAVGVAVVAVVVLLLSLRSYTEHGVEMSVPNITGLYLE